MRLIGQEAPAPTWVDLPDGGRLLFRHPTWEDRDRAVTRAANKTEGKQELADVHRELLVMLLEGQEGFGRAADKQPAELPDDAEQIVASLSLEDVRTIEAAVLYPLDEAEAAVGNSNAR